MIIKGKCNHEMNVQGKSTRNIADQTIFGNIQLLKHQIFMCLSKLQQTVKDREAWRAAVHGPQRVGHDGAAGQPPPPLGLRCQEDNGIGPDPNLSLPQIHKNTKSANKTTQDLQY